MAILELRAARGWSLKQSADTFSLTSATIALWVKRIDAWLPFALPQCWPFCWWVAMVIDHYSRPVMGIETFRNNPTSVSVSHFLESAIRKASASRGQLWRAPSA